MKALALFVVDGVLMLLLAIALVAAQNDYAPEAAFLGAVGAAIAAAAVVASVVFQIRSDQRAPDVD